MSAKKPETRRRSKSWSCRWLPFSCSCGDDEVAAASPMARSLSDDLFWENPANGEQGSSCASGTSSNTSASRISGGSGSTGTTQSLVVGPTTSLSSILEDDVDDILGAQHPKNSVTASRCDGPRCFNCGSVSVTMLGSSLPDAQAHPLMTSLQHELFCNSDCIWTYIFRVTGPNKTAPSTNAQ